MNLLKKALILEPENAEVQDTLGWAYYKKGMLKEALQYLERATNLLPDNAEVQEHLRAVRKGE